MPQILYCRHEDCQEAYVSTAGHRPSLCPACRKAAQWTTEPPHGIMPTARYPDDPIVEWILLPLDRKLLRSFRIAAD